MRPAAKTLVIAALVLLFAGNLLSQVSCSATNSTLPDGTSWWHVRVKPTPESTPKIYSVRYGDERKKAVNDCLKYLKAEEKRQKEELKRKQRKQRQDSDKPAK